MLMSILAVAVPIYAAALYMSYRSAADRLEAGAERDADEHASRLAAEHGRHLEQCVRRVEQ